MNLQQQIDNMRKELASMEAELDKQNEFQWSYEDDSTYCIRTGGISTEYSSDSERYLTNGNYRIHKHNAQAALQLTKETRLIGAIAEQLFPDDKWKAAWSSSLTHKYFIHYNGRNYDTRYHTQFRTLGVHYMSQQTAEAVCEVLNSGKVQL